MLCEPMPAQKCSRPQNPGGHRSLGITMDVAAKQMGVGANYVSLARAVKRIAPEMIAEIRAGKMTLSHASKIFTRVPQWMKIALAMLN
jgi:hypothetical protein